MSNEIMRREMKEAMDAGERALSSLRNAQDKLNSADNCGLFDMFDVFVADYLVQSKISEAKEQVSDAITRVEQILNELKRKM